MAAIPIEQYRCSIGTFGGGGRMPRTVDQPRSDYLANLRRHITDMEPNPGIPNEVEEKGMNLNLLHN